MKTTTYTGIEIIALLRIKLIHMIIKNAFFFFASKEMFVF